MSALTKLFQQNANFLEIFCLRQLFGEKRLQRKVGGGGGGTMFIIKISGNKIKHF